MSDSSAHTSIPSSTSAQQQDFPEVKEEPHEQRHPPPDRQRHLEHLHLLRGPYKRNEYRKVILPLTVLRRFDGLLARTKAKAMDAFDQYKGKRESTIRSVMQGSVLMERATDPDRA